MKRFVQTPPKTKTIQQRRVQRLLHESNLLLLAPMPIQHMATPKNRIKNQGRTQALKKIGLISDTHVPSRARAIPQKVFETFTDVALIIHAGDLTELSVIGELERLAPVIAVQGNMDTNEVKAKLPTTNYAQVDNYRIGVIHSLGSFGTRQKMRKMAQSHKLDIMVSGHLHMPSITWENGTLLINPGSPTNPLPPFLTKPTVATLKIYENHIEPEIIHIK